MTRPRLILAAGLLGALLAGPGSAQMARACGIELVLAMDVSRSVVTAEYHLQTAGMASALRDAEVVEAIGRVPGGIMATVTQWSGPRHQAQAVGWRHLSAPDTVEAFARQVAGMDRKFFAAYTAIGEALAHADTLSAANPIRCARRVIDISGDGASNRGRAPAPISGALSARGVTVNALVILGAKPDPAQYYIKHVVRGPAAFVEIADSFDDFAVAMTRKLVRELTPAVAGR